MFRTFEKSSFVQLVNFGFRVWKNRMFLANHSKYRHLSNFWTLD
jgi:hypothetical protein